MLVHHGTTRSRAESIVRNGPGRNPRETGDQVHRIIEYRCPVILLIHSLRILLGEFALRLKGHDGYHELSHGMRILRQRLYGGKHVIGNMAAALPVGRLSRRLVPFMSCWERRIASVCTTTKAGIRFRPRLAS